MTGVYDWNPVPHRVDVTCPVCRHWATFEFAEVVRIKLKRDVAFFEKSRLFDYRQFQDGCGHLWHAALYFEGLHGDPRQAIGELPDGYAPEDWCHSTCLRGPGGLRTGSISCESCHLRRQHELSWPDEAYYALSYRGQVLWAYHREAAVVLLEFLSSETRDESAHRWSSFLRHVPTVFKTAKAREAVTRQLRKLLAG